MKSVIVNLTWRDMHDLVHGISVSATDKTHTVYLPAAGMFVTVPIDRIIIPATREDSLNIGDTVELDGVRGTVVRFYAHDRRYCVASMATQMGLTGTGVAQDNAFPGVASENCVLVQANATHYRVDAPSISVPSMSQFTFLRITDADDDSPLQEVGVRSELVPPAQSGGTMMLSTFGVNMVHDPLLYIADTGKVASNWPHLSTHRQRGIGRFVEVPNEKDIVPSDLFFDPRTMERIGVFAHDVYKLYPEVTVSIASQRGQSVLVKWELGADEDGYGYGTPVGRVTMPWHAASSVVYDQTRGDVVVWKSDVTDEEKRSMPSRNDHGVCAHCYGILSDADSDVESTKVGAVCRACFDEEFNSCAVCGEHHPANDMTTAYYDGSEEVVCDECLANNFTQCDRCAEYHEDHLVEDGICQDCADNGYRRCASCNSIDEDYEEINGSYYCDHCAEDVGSLHEYNYRPTPKFCGSLSENSPIYLGVEVEMEHEKSYGGTRSFADSASAHPEVYCKRDGSLSDGVELVSHPATLEYHMNVLSWEDLFQRALDNGLLSHSPGTCGLHVHVGVNELGDTDEEREDVKAKLVLLVDRHWEAMFKFSRRRRAQLDRWAARPSVEPGELDTTDSHKKQKGLSVVHKGRYQAVNLQNRKTVEFRFFRGTLKVRTFMATLQLVSNIVQYAKTHSIEECVLHSTFRDIIETKSYQELPEYLEVRNMRSFMEETEKSYGHPIQSKAEHQEVVAQDEDIDDLTFDSI